MKTVQHAGLQCPRCEKKLDCSTNVTGEVGPSAGDFSVCIGCTQILRYTAAMTLEAVSVEDVPFPLRATIAKVRFAAALVKSVRN